MSIGQYKGFSIGSMRQVAIFRQNTPTTDNAGGQGDAYADQVTVRGCLEKKRGNKSLEQSEIVFGKDYVFYCRYNNILTIDTDTIIEINNETYRINNWGLVDEIRHLYQFDISKN